MSGAKEQIELLISVLKHQPTPYINSIGQVFDVTGASRIEPNCDLLLYLNLRIKPVLDMDALVAALEEMVKTDKDAVIKDLEERLDKADEEACFWRKKDSDRHMAEIKAEHKKTLGDLDRVADCLHELADSKGKDAKIHDLEEKVQLLQDRVQLLEDQLDEARDDSRRWQDRYYDARYND